MLLVSLSQEMIRSNFTVVVCCDTLGPRPEGGMGGPSRVGEGHSALAVCPAGPGKAVPPSTPQHRLQQPWSALWGEASQGDSTQLHGIWPTGKHFTHFLIILVSVGQKYKLCYLLQNEKAASGVMIFSILLFFVVDGNASQTSRGCQLHWIPR